METKEDIKIREILEKENVLQKQKKKSEPQFGFCLLYTSPSPRDS